jgi:hypothetical protein
LTALVAAAIGVSVVRFETLVLIVMMAGVLAWASFRYELRWLAAGILTLAYMNAVPFVDLVQVRLPASVRFDDVVVVALAVCGVAWTASEPNASPIGRLRLMLVVFVAYWVLVLAGTVLTGNGTPLLSALY